MTITINVGASSIPEAQIIQAKDDAEEAAANASASESASSTSESNAASSASAAATSESNAATSESNAASSASAAATSESNAASSASAAATSESNAATSESNAASSASAAATSESNAATSESNAASSASAAATSESNAATSESNAASSASAAAASESSVASSASAAATSESNAATSESNAASSASAAATSESNAAFSASSAATSESNAATSESNAASSASSAATSESNAASSASAAATSESNAATSESNAATSESNAASSASSAATSESNAAFSATQAQNANTSVLNIFDTFDDRFLGAKTEDPILDNDGNPISAGAVYYNTAQNLTKFYNGASWDAPSSQAETSATNALASENAAASSASSASTSESNAAASASAASTSESNAAASESAAALSESNAAASESAAALSETNAAASASAASTSESNAATSETNAAASESAAALSETNAAASASSASTSETNAAASESAAALSETNAAASASAASTSESNAATSESNAAASASAASTSESNAATSASNAAASLDEFTDLYLGSKTSDPTLDNDNNALQTGALYFNSVDEVIKVYDGASWQAAFVSLSGALIASNNLSDLGDPEAARSNLGVAIGENVLAFNQNLNQFINAFVLPSADGTSGQALTTNGAGTLAFTSVQGVGSDNHIYVPDASSLSSALSIANSASPGGSAKSATNRVQLILGPGVYSSITLTTDYVDIIGLGNGVVFTSVDAGTSLDTRVKNIQTAVLTKGGGSSTILEDLIVTNRWEPDGVELAGTYKNIKLGYVADNNNPSTYSGTFENIDGPIRVHGGSGAVLSGVFRNCHTTESTQLSAFEAFGQAGNGGVTYTGDFLNCSGGFGSFGYLQSASNGQLVYNGAYFKDCKAGSNSFGYVSGVGPSNSINIPSNSAVTTFENCSAEGDSFFVGKNYARIYNVRLVNCVAGAGSFMNLQESPGTSIKHIVQNVELINCSSTGGNSFFYGAGMALSNIEISNCTANGSNSFLVEQGADSGYRSTISNVLIDSCKVLTAQNFCFVYGFSDVDTLRISNSLLFANPSGTFFHNFVSDCPDLNNVTIVNCHTGGSRAFGHMDNVTWSASYRRLYVTIKDCTAGDFSFLGWLEASPPTIFATKVINCLGNSNSFGNGLSSYDSDLLFIECKCIGNDSTPLSTGFVSSGAPVGRVINCYGGDYSNASTTNSVINTIDSNFNIVTV